MNQIETLVRTVLRERGVPASDEEIEALVSDTKRSSRAWSTLYVVTDGRDDQPAVSFVPNANVSQW